MTNPTWQKPEIFEIPKEIADAINQRCDADGWYTAILTDDAVDWIDKHAKEMSYGRYLAFFTL